MNTRYRLTLLVGTVELTFTSHAQERMQQRGITLDIVKFVIEHGKPIRTHNDVRYALSDKNVDIPKAFQEKLGKNPRVIVNPKDKRIITVEIGYKRIKNKPGRHKRRGKGRRR